MPARCTGSLRLALGWVLGAACTLLYISMSSSEISMPLLASSGPAAWVGSLRGGGELLSRGRDASSRRQQQQLTALWSAGGGPGGFGGMGTPAADANITRWRIPRVLHQTWKTHETPPNCDGYRATWTTLNPTWTVRLWNDTEGQALLAEHFPNLTLALKEHNVSEGVKIADITRIVILYVHGGIYADLDMEALRPFEPLLATHERSPWPVVLGAEPSKHAEGQGGRNLLVCNALMVSPKGHPFWKTLLDHIEAAVGQQGEGDEYVSPVDLTGPMLYTNLLDHTPAAFDGVFVYPSNAFYPREDDDFKLDPVDASVGAWAVHRWVHTWFGNTGAATWSYDYGGPSYGGQPWEARGGRRFGGFSSGTYGASSYSYTNWVVAPPMLRALAPKSLPPSTCATRVELPAVVVEPAAAARSEPAWLAPKRANPAVSRSAGALHLLTAQLRHSIAPQHRAATDPQWCSAGENASALLLGAVVLGLRSDTERMVPGTRRRRRLDVADNLLHFNAMHILRHSSTSGDVVANDPNTARLEVSSLAFCGSALPVTDTGTAAAAALGYDAGLVAAGGSSEKSCQIVVDFSVTAGFVVPPIVLATTRGQNFSDTFAVSTRQVSNASVVLNVLRVDTVNEFSSDGWAQELEIEFIALGQQLRWPTRGSGGGGRRGGIGLSPSLTARAQRFPGVLHQARVHVGNHSGEDPVQIVVVPFSGAWSKKNRLKCGSSAGAAGKEDCSRLRVFAMARNAPGTDYDDVFSVVVCAVDRSGFSARITRLDATTGWDQELELDYAVVG